MESRIVHHRRRCVGDTSGIRIFHCSILFLSILYFIFYLSLFILYSIHSLFSFLFSPLSSSIPVFNPLLTDAQHAAQFPTANTEQCIRYQDRYQTELPKTISPNVQPQCIHTLPSSVTTSAGEYSSSPLDYPASSYIHPQTSTQHPSSHQPQTPPQTQPPATSSLLPSPN